MSEFQFGKMQGVAETLSALEEMRPGLHDELVKKVDSAAKDIAAAVDAAVPGDAPMSGMDDHDGRTGWRVGRGGAFAARYDKTKVSDAEWPVYRVGMSGAASVMSDIAASGNTRSGEEMVAVLNRVGSASRWVWPTGKANVSKIVGRMQAAVDKLEGDMNAKLGE